MGYNHNIYYSSMIIKLLSTFGMSCLVLLHKIDIASTGSYMSLFEHLSHSFFA
jgi:hypothetical protein